MAIRHISGNHLRFGTAGLSLPPLALNSPAAAAGDSWFSGSVNYLNANDNRGINWGALTSMLEYAGNGVRFTFQGNKAVSGTTTTQILATVPSAIATMSGPGTLFLDGGLNDISASVPTATIISNWNASINLGLAAGHRMACLAIPPADPSTPFTAPQEASRQAANAALLNRSNSSVNVFVSDNIGLTHSDYANQIHLTTNGFADKLAPAWSAYLSSWWPTQSALNFGTIYTTNPTLSGGTVGGPTGWTLSVANAGGATATWDTSAKNLTIGGSFVGTTPYVELSQLFTSSFPSTADFDEAILGWRMIGSPSQLLQIELQVELFEALTFNNLMASYATLYAPGVTETATSNTYARAPGSYVSRGPMSQVKSGTPTSCLMSLKIGFPTQASLTAVSIVLGLDYCAMRKIT